MYAATQGPAITVAWACSRLRPGLVGGEQVSAGVRSGSANIRPALGIPEDPVDDLDDPLKVVHDPGRRSGLLQPSQARDKRFRIDMGHSVLLP